MSASDTTPRRSTPDTVEEHQFLHEIASESQKIFTLMAKSPVVTEKMIAMQGELVLRMLKRMVVLDEINKQK